MITEKIKISNGNEGFNNAINLTEDFAKSLKLEGKKYFHVRLLAEEMFSMLEAITGNFNAEYWIEFDENNNLCTFNLDASANIDFDAKQELLSASTKGKNIAVNGIMEKIREIVEYGLYHVNESLNLQAQYGSGLLDFGVMGLTNSEISQAVYTWSMNKYKNVIDDQKNNNDNIATEAYDELERSIIANIADEVKVGVKNNRVNLIIEKKI